MPGSKDHYHILMGDVIRSSEFDPDSLGSQLKDFVKSANDALGDDTLSPYTVTLGDEFQGVTRSLKSGIETLIYFEEQRLEQQLRFQMHYVLHYGTIDTAINPETSYGMLGEGLREARDLLASKKRGRKRFKFSLQDDEMSEQLNRIFEVLDGISKRWKMDDFDLILDMIRNDNDQDVGEKHGKDRTQIYRRRNTLMISEYNLLRNFIMTYIDTESS
ncbi:MAG: SatD family protein [Balneolaceae bacterium]|nr:SatD family protein [Balneolaceae bacterium]